MAKIYYIGAAELPFFPRVAHLSLDGDTSSYDVLHLLYLDLKENSLVYSYKTKAVNVWTNNSIVTERKK